MNFGTNEDQLAIKKYIISLLVKQALSDDEFSLVEKKYLNYVGESLNLTDVDLAVIRHNPDQYKISPPPDEVKRVSILYYLLFMMRIDQKITTQEEEVCYKVGLRLGFRQDMIANLIGVMKKYLKQELPPDAMLEKIKPYLN